MTVLHNDSGMSLWSFTSVSSQAALVNGKQENGLLLVYHVSPCLSSLGARGRLVESSNIMANMTKCYVHCRHVDLACQLKYLLSPRSQSKAKGPAFHFHKAVQLARIISYLFRGTSLVHLCCTGWDVGASGLREFLERVCG